MATSDPRNRFGVQMRTIESKNYIYIEGPVHGPIKPDEALLWAAWLIYHAAPHSKLKVAELLKQIQSGKKH